ncbi:hypothetical protein LINPERPRIM_LOCUS3534 [Linum perenne]
MVKRHQHFSLQIVQHFLQSSKILEPRPFFIRFNLHVIAAQTFTSRFPHSPTFTFTSIASIHHSNLVLGTTRYLHLNVLLRSVTVPQHRLHQIELRLCVLRSGRRRRLRLGIRFRFRRVR